MKLPSFQFYPGDWMKDPALRSVSAAARGVWIDMLCLMFECPRRGILRTKSGPWTIEDVARTCRVRPQFVREIIDAGVCSLGARTGTIYSRRMVRDERIRRFRANAGQLGGKQKASKTLAAPTKNLKQKPPPSSSSSSSSSSSEVRENESTHSPASAKPPPPPKAHDPIWDIIAEIWFASPPGAGVVAPPDRTRVGKLTRQLKQHGATPDEIRLRVNRHRSAWPNAEASPESLVKHWARFAQDELPRAGGNGHNNLPGPPDVNAIMADILAREAKTKKEKMQ